jgi:hypothetical protein
MGSKFWYLVFSCWFIYEIYDYMEVVKKFEKAKDAGIAGIHGDTTRVMISGFAIIAYFIFSWINKTDKANNTNQQVNNKK